jgi:DNA polymerase III delta subunit
MQAEALAGLQEEQTERSSPKTRKKKAATDLLMAINAANPYPVYLQLQKTEKFTSEELFGCFEHLHQADLQLKTTGHDPKIILENLILYICRGVRHVENQNCMHYRSLM